MIPAKRQDQEDQEFEGATVIEPIRGYYDVPIAVLDFASLYPSIMIAHNLCYTTFVKNNQDISPADDYVQTPSGSFFIKFKKGLLPQILENLIKQRKKTKEMMKSEKDPFKYKVLDARQIALKVSANSVYALRGAVKDGILPSLDL